MFDRGLQFLPHFHQRQRQPHRQLSFSHNLELRLGFSDPSLIGFPHSGSPLEKRLIIPDSIRARAESRYFLFQVSTKGGTTSSPSDRVIELSFVRQTNNGALDS